MPKKYRYILAWLAIIGMIAAVWFWGFHRQPTLRSCIAGYLTALGMMSARALLKAYLQYDKREKSHKIKKIPAERRGGNKNEKFNFCLLYRKNGGMSNENVQGFR